MNFARLLTISLIIFSILTTSVFSKEEKKDVSPWTLAIIGAMVGGVVIYNYVKKKSVNQNSNNLKFSNQNKYKITSNKQSKLNTKTQLIKNHFIINSNSTLDSLYELIGAVKNNNIVHFYSFLGKINQNDIPQTELERKVFTKSTQYQKLKESYPIDKNKFINSKKTIIITELKWHSYDNYDLTKSCFPFTISEDPIIRSQPGKITNRILEGNDKFSKYFIDLNKYIKLSWNINKNTYNKMLKQYDQDMANAFQNKYVNLIKMRNNISKIDSRYGKTCLNVPENIAITFEKLIKKNEGSIAISFTNYNLSKFEIICNQFSIDFLNKNNNDIIYTKLVED